VKQVVRKMGKPLVAVKSTSPTSLARDLAPLLRLHRLWGEEGGWKAGPGLVQLAH